MRGFYAVGNAGVGPAIRFGGVDCVVRRGENTARRRTDLDHLRLLLVGAALLITAPILCRQPDRHLSYIGRSIVLFVGPEAVGLSLASLARDLLHGPIGVTFALVVAIVLVARDSIDYVNAVRYLHLLADPGIARLDTAKYNQHEPES